MINKTLLISDDEEELVENLKFDLRKTVKNIISATDGVQALLEFKEGDIDCIISDINMPEKDGITFIKEVRELGFQGPVIFLTAHGDDQLMKKALSLNAFDFIHKPYQPDELIEMITDALEKKESDGKECPQEQERQFHDSFNNFLKKNQTSRYK